MILKAKTAKTIQCKDFTELVKKKKKKSDLDKTSYENIKESYIDEYGLHINRTSFSILDKNLISSICNFCFFDSKKELNIDKLINCLNNITLYDGLTPESETISKRWKIPALNILIVLCAKQTTGRGGLENFKKSNSRGDLNFRGWWGVGKMKKSQFLCKMKYKLFNVDYLQSKEYKGKE